MEAKENRKRAASQIKILAASKVAPDNSDSNASTRVPHKKKARTSFLSAHKQKGKNNPKYSGAHSYCVL